MLSSLAPYPITLEGKTWPTSEHYFRAMQYIDDPNYVDVIRQSQNPTAISKKEGIREGWNFVKEEIMFNAIRAKFMQHPELYAELMATGDKTIRLASKRPDNISMNNTLMRVREYLKENRYPIRPPPKVYATDASGRLIIQFK